MITFTFILNSKKNCYAGLELVRDRKITISNLDHSLKTTIRSILRRWIGSDRKHEMFVLISRSSSEYFPGFLLQFLPSLSHILFMEMEKTLTTYSHTFGGNPKSVDKVHLIVSQQISTPLERSFHCPHFMSWEGRALSPLRWLLFGISRYLIGFADAFTAGRCKLQREIRRFWTRLWTLCGN